jgi:hypothetical protein
MSAVTIRDAARALGVSAPTVRRWLRDGAPVLRRGGRGRGRVALLDVDALAAWRRMRDGGTAHDALVVLAAEIPELVADAMHEAFVLVDGPHKRACAGALAGAGYLAIVALLDRMRRDDQRVPEVTTLPAKIDQLRLHFRRCV